MAFTFSRLPIPEILLIESKSHLDDRGYFLESFKESDFAAMGIKTKFVQDNFSHSHYGVLRGLHYQKKPKAQAKLVLVTKGEILDVVVDIRKSSPTYGKWISEKLSETNHKLLYVPEGFAHGFCVLSKEADVFYKVSNEYSPENEAGIIWNDPSINISWPIKTPIISKKDLQLPSLEKTETSF